jgi:ATP-dependent RNA helicase DDX18/HAS1
MFTQVETVTKEQKFANGISIIVATAGYLFNHMQNTLQFMYKNQKGLVINETDHILIVNLKSKLLNICQHIDRSCCSS